MPISKNPAQNKLARQGKAHQWSQSLSIVSFYAVLAVLIGYLVITKETVLPLSPAGVIKGLNLDYGPNFSDNVLGVLCGLTTAGIIAWGLLRRFSITHERIFRIAATSVLVVIAACSIFAFLYMARGVAFENYAKIWDSYHYLLGSKYYDELSYTGLYDCTAAADAEGGKFLRDHDALRDLRTYKKISVKKARQRCIEEFRDNFSTQRWDSFVSDVRLYEDIAGANLIRRMVRDHGYNGTPFHAYIAGTIANAAGPLDHETMIHLTLIDTLGLIAMMGFVTWGFGWRWGLLFAIFFATSYTDRFYFIGGSFVRYWWMIPLGAGIAFMNRGRYAVAAVLISAAGMLNIFPLLFVAGLGVKMLVKLMQERRLSRVYRRFIVAVVLSSLYFGALSVSYAGRFQNYTAFLDNMGKHTELITRSRIGFRYNFLFRGEIYDGDARYSNVKKQEELDRIKPLHYGLAALFLAFCFILIPRLGDVEATILGGFSSFFFMFGTVEYYYGIYALTVLLWKDRTRDRGGIVMAAMPWILMTITHLLWHETRSLRFCNNTVMSATITLYLAAGMLYLARAEGLLSDLGSFIRRSHIARIVTAALVLGLATLLYTLGDMMERENMPLAERAAGPVLAFGGDVTVGRRINSIQAEKGPKYALGQVKALKNADLSIVNLEGVIASTGRFAVEKGETGPYYFRGRPETLAILTEAGVDVVGEGNNHSGDYGIEALREQWRYLDEAGIGRAGTGRTRDEACSPVVRRAANLVVAIFSVDATMPHFAATDATGGSCYISLEDPSAWRKELDGRIERARQTAHVVLVAVHWGPNLRSAPSKDKIIAGRAMVDAGADAVLGTSAHMLQGIEVYKDRPIIHDAGNLIFDYTDDKINRSAVFELVLSKQGVRQVWATPLVLGRMRAVPASGEAGSAVLERLQELSADLGTRAKIVGDKLLVDLPGLPVRSIEPPRAVEVGPNPEPGPAPEPLTVPPSQCVSDHVPAFAAIEPIPMGPLTLVGYRPVDKVFRERSVIYFETYWTLPEPIDKDLRIQFTGRPSAEGQRTWFGSHEPCDWQWPTSRWKAGTIYRDYYGMRPARKLASTDLSITLSVNDSQTSLGSWDAEMIRIELPE